MSSSVLTAAAMLAMLLSAVSCSIKEDRSECPCTVSVRTQTDSNCVVSFYEDGQLLERKGISADLLCSGENYTRLKRGVVTVSAVSGTSSLEFTDTSVYCRSGYQFGQVSAFVRTEGCNYESVLVEGDLHKQYCKVKLYVKDAVSGEYPYKALFKAPCNGMNLMTLAPVAGAFIHEPLFDAANSCVVLLPRQRNNDDIILVMSDESGEEIGKVNLGKYFLAAAYDWEAESLSDITIVIDFSLSTISIKMNDWIQVFILKYEI